MADPIAPFAPALSELLLDIFERIDLQAGAVNTSYMTSARRSMNMVLVKWAGLGINRWRVAPVTVPLVVGQATYPVDGAVIDVLDTYITTTFGGVATDIIITHTSENTYAALPKKMQPGRPILAWYQRLIPPRITLWPVPDSTVYSMTYYAFSQILDLDPSGGNVGNIPYRFLEAFCAGTAAHLAMKFKPERFAMLDGYAKEEFASAADGDAEKITLTLAPCLDDFFR